ncbi:MAG: hypothetical protein IH945_03555 [Armatimonadetes bacterium]|nr:hypothetical protein [Armatimonadota bacterium]
MTERERIKHDTRIALDQAAILNNFFDFVIHGDESAMKRPLPSKVERVSKRLIDGEGAAS